MSISAVPNSPDASKVFEGGWRFYCRDAGGGVGVGGRGAYAPPPRFGISLNPIWTKGGRLGPLYYYVPPHLFGRCGVSGDYSNVKAQLGEFMKETCTLWNYLISIGTAYTFLDNNIFNLFWQRHCCIIVRMNIFLTY